MRKLQIVTVAPGDLDARRGVVSPADTKPYKFIYVKEILWRKYNHWKPLAVARRRGRWRNSSPDFPIKTSRPRSFRISSFVSSTHSAARCSGRHSPGEKSSLHLQRNWARAKGRSSGATAAKFPAPALRSPMAR